MCGRVTLDIDIELLRQILEGAYGVQPDQMYISGFERRYNVAPGQQVLSIINDGDSNRAGYMKWGFIPPYAHDPKEGGKLINIRSETADSKPTFSDSFRSKRCLVMADSFYEWNSLGGPRIPYRIRSKEDPMMSMAGLWSRFVDREGKVHFTCAVLTTAANDKLKNVHHRMPVILKPEDTGLWLSGKDEYGNPVEPEVLKGLMRQYDPEQLSMYPVSDLVNNVKIDSEECIARRDEE